MLETVYIYIILLGMEVDVTGSSSDSVLPAGLGGRAFLEDLSKSAGIGGKLVALLGNFQSS